MLPNYIYQNYVMSESNRTFTYNTIYVGIRMEIRRNLQGSLFKDKSNN